MLSALRRSGFDSVSTATRSVISVRTSVAMPASCLLALTPPAGPIARLVFDGLVDMLPTANERPRLPVLPEHHLVAAR
jgi:hypothetical protein